MEFAGGLPVLEVEMSVRDVIKSSVLESLGGTSGFNLGEICIILFVSCLIGIYIFFVYKGFCKSAFYSKDLNITLAGMCVAVAAIMIAMQSNILVSLGMVGALSIVRFRTAIKNPLDLLYLFWSISGGIICGVGLYVLAIVLCVIMTLIIWGLGVMPGAKTPTLVIVRALEGVELSAIEKSIKSNCKYVHQCQSMIKNSEHEAIYEVLAPDMDKVVNELSKIDKVKSVNCLEHDGEIRA